MALSIAMICFHAECSILFIIILNVVMLSVILLNVVMLSLVMLSVVMLNVVMLNVVMLGVMAPLLALKKLYGCPLAIADKDNRPVLNKLFTASNLSIPYL
jgi:hypothetical protein